MVLGNSTKIDAVSSLSKQLKHSPVSPAGGKTGGGIMISLESIIQGGV